MDLRNTYTHIHYIAPARLFARSPVRLSAVEETQEVQGQEVREGIGSTAVHTYFISSGNEGAGAS
jgi:hypothetical protein